MQWMLGAVVLSAVYGCTGVVEADHRTSGGEGSAGGSSTSGGTTACGQACPDGEVGVARARVTPTCTRALSFAPKAAYGVAAGAKGVEITDLNGDGRPDLVVPTWHHDLRGGYDVTRVLLNKGDGSFESGVEYARNQDLVAVGDLNRDGKPDLVVTAPSPNALTVLLNKGDGSFTAQPAMRLSAAPTTPLQGAVGDMDGDGIPDLYWSTGGTLRALHGNGDGTFAFTPVTTTFPDADSLKAADLDGDNRVDVIATTGAAASLDVFLNHGDGTFPPRGARYSPAAGRTGWFLVDWNRDGKPDIFTTGTSYTVLLNSGKGTFEARLAMSLPATPSPPDYMTVADMNGDGHADILGGFEGGSRDTINVWLNDGHNVFTTAARADVTRYGVGIQAADLDGDGRLDLVALSQPGSTSSVVSVLLNAMCSP